MSLKSKNETGFLNSLPNFCAKSLVRLLSRKIKYKHIKWPHRMLEVLLSFDRFMEYKEYKYFFTQLRYKYISYFIYKLLAKKIKKIEGTPLNRYFTNNSFSEETLTCINLFWLQKDPHHNLPTNINLHKLAKKIKINIIMPF